MNIRLLKKVLEAQRDLYLRPKDKILFVLAGDFRNAPLAAVFEGYAYDVIRITAIKRPGQDYHLDENLLDGKTVGWLISNISISHSPSTRKMVERGMFLISNPGISPDWPAVLDPANRVVCRRNAESILRAIGGDIGGEVRITAEDGTDLRLKVPNGNWQLEVGDREGVGTNGLYGELVTSPYWAEGTYVLSPGDFLTNPINRVREKIRLTIRDNHVVRIEGGSQAKTLRRMLKQAHNSKAYCLGEFAFGVNPGRPAKIHRSVVAEKLSGGIHIAIGTNSVCLKEGCPEIGRFPYGRYSAGVHIDCIKFHPRVTSQGKPIL